MTPWQIAKTTEHSHQCALFAWVSCASLYGPAAANDPLNYDFRTRTAIADIKFAWLSMLFAVHNQGHGDAIRGAQARAEGVKKGVPDTMLPVARHGYHGLFIELKVPKAENKPAGKLSDEQKSWIDALKHNGYKVATCYGWIEAAEVLTNYMENENA
jgi:hypothetical protein